MHGVGTKQMAEDLQPGEAFRGLVRPERGYPVDCEMEMGPDSGPWDSAIRDPGRARRNRPRRRSFDIKFRRVDGGEAHTSPCGALARPAPVVSVCTTRRCYKRLCIYSPWRSKFAHSTTCSPSSQWKAQIGVKKNGKNINNNLGLFISEGGSACG